MESSHGAALALQSEAVHACSGVPLGPAAASAAWRVQYAHGYGYAMMHESMCVGYSRLRRMLSLLSVVEVHAGRRWAQPDQHRGHRTCAGRQTVRLMAGVTDAAPCGNSWEFPSPGGSSAAGCAGVTLLETCRATSAGPEPSPLWKLSSDLTENIRSEDETRGAQDCTAGRGAVGCLRWLTTLPRARSRLPSARPDPLWALLMKDTMTSSLQGALELYPGCSPVL